MQPHIWTDSGHTFGGGGCALAACRCNKALILQQKSSLLIKIVDNLLQCHGISILGKLDGTWYHHRAGVSNPCHDICMSHKNQKSHGRRGNTNPSFVQSSKMPIAGSFISYVV